jgi:hypothetical protein
MDSQKLYCLFDDDSLSDSFSTPPGSNPFSTPPGSNPFSAPPSSPISFHSAAESLATEINPFEVQFALANANYILDSLDLTHPPSSSGTDPLFGTFDPDATRLIVSPATFADDPFWDHIWYPTSAATTNDNDGAESVVTAGDEDEWEWVSAFDDTSTNGLSKRDVQDVTPRERWPLRMLHPAGSTLYWKRALEMESEYGAAGEEEEVYEGFGDAETCAAPERIGVKPGGQPRVSVSGRRLPVVVETGAIGKARSDTGCLDVKVKVD